MAPTTKATNKKPINKSKSNKSKTKINISKIIKALKHKSAHAGKFNNGRFRPFGTKVNWYWDIRLWSPVIIIMLIIASCTGTNNNDEPIDIQDPIVEVGTIETTEPKPTLSIEETNIIALARLADTVGHGRNNEVKEIIMWVAINRVEDNANGYGGSLQTEIARPKQWQQYDPDGIYLIDTYELAQSVYNSWMTNGPRPIYSDMLWFTLNGDGSITVRNRFNNDGKNRTEMTFGQE